MDTSFMDFSYFVIMFMVALVAGFINVVSGGGGFLSIGALLISGLPPANALATNKIGLWVVHSPPGFTFAPGAYQRAGTQVCVLICLYRFRAGYHTDSVH